MTIDPTRPAEQGGDAIRVWTPDAPPTDSGELPVFAASAAAAGWPSAPHESDPPPFQPAAPGAPAAPGRTRRWAVLILAALLVVSLALAGYLLATTLAHQDRAAWFEGQARGIGTDLATTRSELEGTTAELEAVRTQLETAQARITALADEKAQVGDDREAQRQLVDLQHRVSEAAGTVASALERCVQGQETLIGYLNNPAAYDPAQLTAFGVEVDRLCQSATKANESLQDELSK